MAINEKKNKATTNNKENKMKTNNKEINMKNPPIALITGANRGLGLEAAKQLAASGTQVILSGRDIQALEDARNSLPNDGLVHDVVQIDVTNSAQITAAVAAITEKHGRIDILLNNAGAMLEGDWGQNNSLTVSRDVLRSTFDINLFGLIEVTQAFLPLLQKSDSGRIVNVSSILGSLSVQSDTTSAWAGVKPYAYNASKTALNMFTVSLSQELSESNIKVNSAHPGWVRTKLGTDAAPMDVTEGAKTLVQLARLSTNGPTGGFFHLGEQLAW